MTISTLGHKRQGCARGVNHAPFHLPGRRNTGEGAQECRLERLEQHSSTTTPLVGKLGLLHWKCGATSLCTDFHVSFKFFCPIVHYFLVLSRFLNETTSSAYAIYMEVQGFSAAYAAKLTVSASQDIMGTAARVAMSKGDPL